MSFEVADIDGVKDSYRLRDRLQSARSNSICSLSGAARMSLCLFATLFTAETAYSGTTKPLAEYRAMNRAQANRALGYAETAAASPLCPAWRKEVTALRSDLLTFYGIPVQPSYRDAMTRAGVRAGAAEAKTDMRQPIRYCDGLDEVLAVWRSYTLRPDTEY